MKTLKLLVVVAALFLSTFSSAQTALVIGASAGADLSKFTMTGNFALTGEAFENGLGYQGGVDFGIKIKRFALMSGVKYQVNQGNSFNDRYNLNGNGWVIYDELNEEYGLYFGKRRIKYQQQGIRIPLYLQYSIVKNDALEIFLGCGMNLNYNLGEYKETVSFELAGDHRFDPLEYTSNFGEQPIDLIKASFTSFHFNTGIAYKINDQTRLKLSANWNSANEINNPNLQLYDMANDRYRSAFGEINLSSLGIELGVTYDLDIRIGTKY